MWQPDRQTDALTMWILWCSICSWCCLSKHRQHDNLISLFTTYSLGKITYFQLQHITTYFQGKITFSTLINDWIQEKLNLLCRNLWYYHSLLTLSLPIFWQFCSPSATFFLTARGIIKSQAHKFFKILIFLDFLLITINKYPIFDVSMKKILWTLHNVYKQRDLNQVRRGVQVADRRRWQSAMTSPIGDVGSERVIASLE